MGHVERQLSSEIDSACLFYTRYVDDTFAIVKDTFEASRLLNLLNSAHRLLNLLNSAHTNLSFTTELEDNDCIPFLDVKIHRHQDASPAISIFRKKTWTGVFLNFHSFTPVSWKRGLVKSLFTHAVRLCSPEFLASALLFAPFFLTQCLSRSLY